MILQMERELDFDIMYINIELNQKVLNNEEIFPIIIQELNKIKNRVIFNENNQPKKDKHNEEKYKHVEGKLIILQKKSNQQEEEIKQIKEQYQKDINVIKKEIFRNKRSKIYSRMLGIFFIFINMFC